MNDIYNVAQKVTEWLYGGDKVKFEIIFYLLKCKQKISDIREFTKSLSEGNLDGCIIGYLEFLEDIIDFENKEMVEELINGFRDFCMPISELKKYLKFVYYEAHERIIIL